MTRDDLEQLYGTLCTRLTEAGEENTNIVLARLAMLLLQQADDVARATALIEKAAEGYRPAAAAATTPEFWHDV